MWLGKLLEEGLNRAVVAWLCAGRRWRWLSVTRTFQGQLPILVRKKVCGCLMFPLHDLSSFIDHLICGEIQTPKNLNMMMLVCKNQPIESIWLIVIDYPEWPIDRVTLQNELHKLVLAFLNITSQCYKNHVKVANCRTPLPKFTIYIDRMMMLTSYHIDLKYIEHTKIYLDC